MRPERLKAHLSGKTHVILRVQAEPKREFRELRYYDPDGSVRGFEEEDGTIKPIPVAVTWKTDEQGLATESSIAPGIPFRYTIMRRRDGNISYYFYEPGAKNHGWLAFRTADVREGEPKVL